MPTPRSIDSLLDIVDQVDAFFLDMFGVLWNGQSFYPEALHVCQHLIQKQKKVYVLTNTTILKKDFKERYGKFGFIPNVHYTDIITSGDVLKFELDRHALLDKITNSKDSRYFLIGCVSDVIFHKVISRKTNDISQASVVYFGVPLKFKNNKWVTVKSVRSFVPDLKQALQYHLPAICANPDYFAMKDKSKYITQGSLGKWYEKHKGKVYWIGKPYDQLYMYALQKTKLSPKRCVMVGDTIRTDILGGKNAGMKTILITGYGITHDRMQKGETLDQIAKQEKAYPDFLLSVLR